MSATNRIHAIATDNSSAENAEFLLTDEADGALTAETEISENPYSSDEWGYAEEPEPEAESWFRRHVAPLVAILAITLWTVAFFWTYRATVLSGGSLGQWVNLIRDWSLPVSLVGVTWLLVVRSSKREAQKFGAVARQLADESARLEVRLTSINGELSLARDFIAAQSRDLESLGRVATDRINQSADQLRTMINENSTQIDSIGSVSEAALVNMEKLRGQLPVIANSARDVTNNMGNAGRTAHAQLQEMINGFKRLNEFGQASERQVETLRKLVADTIDDLTTDTQLMEQIATRRFSSIVEQSASFRSQLESYEAQAISALQSRLAALAEDVEKNRIQFDEREANSLAALQSRINALRDESSTVSAALQRSEQTAVDSFTQRLATIETTIAERHEQQRAHIDSIAVHTDALADQMGVLEKRIVEIVGQASTADASLTTSVQGLTERLSEGKSLLIGANSEIATLTDASVRLLEIIEAGSQHGREKIPAALAEAEAKLAAVEERLSALQVRAGDVVSLGDKFQSHVANANESMTLATLELGALHGSLAERTDAQSASLEQLRNTLEQIETKSEVLAARAQSELSSAIEHLTVSASQAVAGIEGDNAAAILRIANKIGDETRISIDKVLQERTAEVAGQLEAAVEKAASVSRAATIQLRDQLTKVDELAGNLERRVTQARDRAEEQVDNDFARRVALITEALNSNAIDIAKTLDTEISDNAWNAYLKGDRGIFTRRAVNLIQNTEAKAIIQFYQNDDDFRSHTNRFIHDFEAMLRQILSTRDGNALGVTLLSSDMGKLYVALAQAIERLRN